LPRRYASRKDEQVNDYRYATFPKPQTIPKSKDRPCSIPKEKALKLHQCRGLPIQNLNLIAFATVPESVGQTGTAGHA
jgi:hypothetical protein